MDNIGTKIESFGTRDGGCGILPTEETILVTKFLYNTFKKYDYKNIDASPGSNGDILICGDNCDVYLEFVVEGNRTNYALEYGDSYKLLCFLEDISYDTAISLIAGSSKDTIS
jgi:hypothetical protein